MPNIYTFVLRFLHLKHSLFLKTSVSSQIHSSKVLHILNILNKFHSLLNCNRYFESSLSSVLSLSNHCNILLFLSLTTNISLRSCSLSCSPKLYLDIFLNSDILLTYGFSVPSIQREQITHEFH